MKKKKYPRVVFSNKYWTAIEGEPVTAENFMSVLLEGKKIMEKADKANRMKSTYLVLPSWLEKLMTKSKRKRFQFS